jgi:hypothetical protein
LTRILRAFNKQRTDATRFHPSTPEQAPRRIEHNELDAFFAKVFAGPSRRGLLIFLTVVPWSRTACITDRRFQQ